jgi:hypothetical protein
MARASKVVPSACNSGLLADCGDDLDARVHLETAKEELHTHFRVKYDKPLPTPTAPVAPTSTINGSHDGDDDMLLNGERPRIKRDTEEGVFRQVATPGLANWETQ